MCSCFVVFCVTFTSRLGSLSFLRFLPFIHPHHVQIPPQAFARFAHLNYHELLQSLPPEEAEMYAPPERYPSHGEVLWKMARHHLRCTPASSTVHHPHLSIHTHPQTHTHAHLQRNTPCDVILSSVSISSLVCRARASCVLLVVSRSNSRVLSPPLELYSLHSDLRLSIRLPGFPFLSVCFLYVSSFCCIMFSFCCVWEVRTAFIDFKFYSCAFLLL